MLLIKILIQRCSALKTAHLLKTISPTVALIYAFILGVIGFSILWFGVNGYAFLFAVIGFVVYVGFYSLWTKRTSIHQTVIGSISGASPPVIGYTAVTHQFDVAALLLFLAYGLWQMPHFGQLQFIVLMITKMQEFQFCL